MAINTLKEQQQALSGWLERLPEQVVESLGDRPWGATVGERHGSWLLRLTWAEDEVIRFADLALTNSEAIPDELSTFAVLTVSAAATTSDRYIVEIVYERRRSIARIPEDFIVDQLAVAVRRAIAFTPVNLTSRYLTGGEAPSEVTP